MTKRISEQEFQEALEEKRHEELLGALKSIASHVKESKPNFNITPLLKQNEGVIKEFLDKLEKIEGKEIEVQPEVKVNIDNKEVLDGIRQMAASISQSLERQNNLLNELVTAMNAEKVIEFKRSISDFIQSPIIVKNKN